MLLFLGGCGKDMKQGTLEGYNYEETDEVTNYVKIVTDKDKVILVELYPDEAPISVANFQKLVQNKYYDGTIFHRVVENFVIQAGGYNKNGLLDEVSDIKGEFANNGVQNDLKHKKGTISMARSDDMDSASSQFFICVSDDLEYLDGNYAAFGQVIAGYETAEEISKVETDIYDRPVTNQEIKTIRFVKMVK